MTDAEQDRIAEAARDLLDCLRSVWSALPAEVVSDPMCRLDEAIGHPSARNYPPGQETAAEVRAEALRPVLALADEWERLDSYDRPPPLRIRLREAARRLRAALPETPEQETDND